MLRQITTTEIDGQGRKVRKAVELRSQDNRNWFMRPDSLLAHSRRKSSAQLFD